MTATKKKFSIRKQQGLPMIKEAKPVIGIVEETDDMKYLISVLLQKLGYDTIFKSTSDRLLDALKSDSRAPQLLFLSTEAELEEINHFASQQNPPVPTQPLVKPLVMHELLRSVYKLESEKVA